MKDVMYVGVPPIAVHVRENKRARRYSLRISNKDGRISLTLPRGARMAEAEKFVAEHEGWLRKHMAKRLPIRQVGLGQQILLDGQYMRIEPTKGRGVQVVENSLLVPGKEDYIPGKIKGFYKTLARDRLVPMADFYAGQLGKHVDTVSIRDTRSRWGSCSSEGKLMFSWRLMMAPRQVQDYVAAHEACHLVEMNHSPAYWALVAKVFPDYKNHRHWLKRNGALLHSFEF